MTSDKLNIAKQKRKRSLSASFIAVILMALIFVFSCRQEGSETGDERTKSSITERYITVYSAVSLTEVMTELGEFFEKDHGIKLRLNLASSGTLARQIEQGGSPDVFISANKKWWDHIEKSGLASKELKTRVGKNALVLISHDEKDSDLGWQEAFDDLEKEKNKRLVIGDPAHVPAGIYARQALENSGYYPMLENKILKVKDVRAALLLVELQEADYGIVYRTDALKSEHITIVDTFPDKSHDTIMYYAGVIQDGAAARRFFNFLSSDRAFSIWKKHGFM